MSRDAVRYCFRDKLDENAVMDKLIAKDLFDNEGEDGEFLEDSFYLTQISDQVFNNKKEADKYFRTATTHGGDNEGWFYYYTKKDGSIVTIVEAVSEHY